MRKGAVINMEATRDAIEAAIDAAERMSGTEVRECWVGIGGTQINALNSRGVVAITGKKRETREIDDDDIQRVIDAAKAVVIPMDREILEVIPRSFSVDDQKDIRNPLDMIGVRLECEVHIITCSLTGLQNLLKCVNRAGFGLAGGFILQLLACGSSCLTEEEKEMGVVLIDLGGGTSDVLVYLDGVPYSTYTIPAGGSHLTSDLSIMKSIAHDAAEKIKTEAGCCWEPLLEDNYDIDIPGVGGRPPTSIPRSQVLGIIKPRMEEIFKKVKERYDDLNLPRPLGAGVVLTGGAAQLPGAAELAEEVFKMPVRLGSPLPSQHIAGLADDYRRPSYSTAIGLLIEGYRRSDLPPVNGKAEKQGKKKGGDLLKKLKVWFKEEFF